MLPIYVLDIIELQNSFLVPQNIQQPSISGLLVFLHNYLGCVIVEMLIGEPLFPGESATD